MTPSSPGTSSSHSDVHNQHVISDSVALSEDDQVGQYRDDIALHTQMQLQLYLEDIEEAEAQAEVDVALAASLDALDPLEYHPSGHFANSVSPDIIPSDTVSAELTAESFQQQMRSLESSVLAAAAVSATAQSFPLDMNINLMQDGLALEHGAMHDLQDEMDDDDEECLPPSETKYILYDDHVSPVSIREALVILNGDLAENRSRYPSHSHLDHPDHDRESPIYSTLSSTLNTNKAALHDERDDDDDNDNDYNFHIRQYEDANGVHSHGAAQGHSSTLGLPSPPPGIKGDFLDQGDLQGRPIRYGPDISLNLAGNVISPITVHELFFSYFYSSLVYLNLWDTNLGTWGAQAVGGLMADSACRIQYLNLGCNRLGFEGIVQLAGLYKNSSLVELDLSENRLGPKSVHSLQQTMVRLQKSKVCNIRRLNLSNNKINDVGCISIAKIILGTSLTHLDLSFNNISDWGASTILAAFESNDLSLKNINLEANPLSFAGGVDICKILALPQSRITHLDLRGAKVTDVGIPYLAEALKSHQCPIVSLNLYDCQLTDTGILKLAIKLSVNKSLRVLGLGSNCIGDMGILALSQGLHLNSHLEELDLGENDIALSRAGLEALISAMRTNTSLVYLNVDIDGHPHAVTRDSNDAGEAYHGFESQTAYQHPQYPQSELQQQQQSPAGVFTNVNSLGFLVAPSGVHVGEVLAPTHAALAQPLQIPSLAPYNHTPALPNPHAPFHNQSYPQGFHPQAPGQQNGRDMERERGQILLALTTLRTYVRHNFRRTARMHSLCFEILVTARVLMFAKDAGIFSLPQSSSLPSPSAPRKNEDGIVAHDVGAPGLKSNQGASFPMIPIQTGLPTPPLLNETATELGTPLVLQDDFGGSDCKGSKEAYPEQITVTTPRPRGTLAGLPWEIKEMILRSLDPNGLLSEKQFQAIMHYSASNWETVRQPWERWGEIREAILEKTHCYYYEP
ncbi:RNA-DNA hybrid ribonuclease [Entomortierella chlamydospora]|uniref:RNA-DNA hybrid ribonuclease n=1 Tax=Entomortierella chlamydospora TaxID=101097 RepID=A0A9P6SYU5_9FUNG|nr:RNA-DNA hybrid ribonuclease [Entomortierella chlamydospora]KAG0012017.1 RNA-DNA hybrid ribonuclease [Entomortierella chlamydospora]